MTEITAITDNVENADIASQAVGIVAAYIAMKQHKDCALGALFLEYMIGSCYGLANLMLPAGNINEDVLDQVHSAYHSLKQGLLENSDQLTANFTHRLERMSGTTVPTGCPFEQGVLPL